MNPAPNHPDTTLNPGDKPLGASLGWHTTHTSTLFTSPWFDLRSDTVQLPQGCGELTYSYVQHPGSVVVVPVLPDGRVLLIRSYRYPTDSWCWELPAGKLEPDTTPEATAHAELLEELGGTCRTLLPLSDLAIANGFAACRTHFFVALHVALEQPTQREPGEHIQQTEALPMPAALDRLTTSGQDGDSALGLLLAERAMRQHPERFTQSGGSP